MDAFKALFSDLPVIDCAYIRTLAQMARKYHMDSAALLAAVGLRGTCLQEIDQRVSVNQFIELLKPDALAGMMTRRRQPGTFRMQKGYDHSYFFVNSFAGDHVAWHAERLH